ncbi:MAG: hypothetical protein HN368_16875 [Spirochaetales bacterium]|nr:hypothetical protein [Spirochaetales bacterium]
MLDFNRFIIIRPTSNRLSDLTAGYDATFLDKALWENFLISAFEFKWGTKRVKAPRSFSEAYPAHHFTTVTKDNWFDFVS